MAGGGLRCSRRRLRHDQRNIVVDAPAAEPVIAAEFQRQPGLAGRHSVAGRIALAGFRITVRWLQRVGRPTLSAELAAARAIHAVG